MPFFNQVWNYFAAFDALDGDFTRTAQLTDEAEARCTGLDFSELRASLERLRDPDPDGR